MSAVRKAGLPAAGLALALGGMAVGKQLAGPTQHPARVVSLVMTATPTVIIEAANAASVRDRLRLSCGDRRLLDGKATEQGAELCAAVAAFAQAAAMYGPRIESPQK